MTVSAETAAVEARRVRARLDTLLAPEAREWEKAAEAVVSLEPTPLDRQPSAYVQTAWSDRPRGQIGDVCVRALTNADALVMRLDWAATRAQRLVSDVNVYADAAAVLFPADGGVLELATMGTPEHPVQGWHWRAGTEEPFVITATGVGTVERAPEHDVVVRARWSDGRWQVVLARPLDSEGVPLAHDSAVSMGFAVWSGSSGERAGLKSYSAQPHELRIGA